MKPNRIILIRHGESEGNVDWDKYLTVPDHCLSLTKTGEKQALKAGEDISNIVGSESVYAYISPYDRTRQTFDQIKLAISENIVRSIEDPRIREQDWGHFKHPDVGEEITQARDAYSTFYYRIPDGESGADVYDRVSTFFETLHRDFGKSDFPKNCLVVTHGLTLRLFLMRWFHWSVEKFEKLVNPENCQIVIMEKNSDEKYQLTTQLITKT